MSCKSPNGKLRHFRLSEWDAEICIGEDVTAPEPLQFQDELEIRLLTRGEAQVQLNGSRYPAKHGWLALIPPGLLHAVTAEGGNAGISFFALRIPPAAFARLDPAAPPQGSGTAPGVVPADPGLASSVFAAHRVLANGAMAGASRSLVANAVRGLAAWAKGFETAPSHTSTRCTPAIDRAVMHLRAHYPQDVALDSLASAAGLSKFHFLRLFSAKLGVTPHRYQLLLRVMHAKVLLRSGLSIADVALRSGFFDQSHFTRCFHEIVGVTPGRYQLDLATPADDPPGKAVTRNFVQDTSRSACQE